MTTNTRPGNRIEGVALVLILLTVAGFAGAASFTHVKDWTLHNSPPGTGQWFGWANAVISELVPVAALLTIRRRRRIGAPIGYPMFLLVAGITLSLAAQLAVAKPGVSGWLLSAVPALAFLGLSKLVLTTGGKTTPTPANVPADDDALGPVDPSADAEPYTAEPRPAPIEQPQPAAVVPAPVTVEQPRPAAVVPVPMSAFTRVNGTPARGANR